MVVRRVIYGHFQCFLIPFATCTKDSFFGYKRTAPTWIGPENHVKNHYKDYQQSMTILTLLHVSSHDKYVQNPEKKPQKHALCRRVKNKRTSVQCLGGFIARTKNFQKDNPTKNRGHIARTRFLQRLQDQMSDKNIYFRIMKYASWILSRFPRHCITALFRANDFSFYPIFWNLKTRVWIYCTNLFFHVLLEMYLVYTSPT